MEQGLELGSSRAKTPSGVQRPHGHGEDGGPTQSRKEITSHPDGQADEHDRQRCARYRSSPRIEGKRLATIPRGRFRASRRQLRWLGHFRTHNPVATASGTAHLAPSLAPVAQTNETNSSSSPQLTDPAPVMTRKVAAGLGSPSGPAGPAGPGGPASPFAPGGPAGPGGLSGRTGQYPA